MSWIAYSLLLFFSSVALYLTVRKSALVKIPTSHTNLAMFAIPAVAYLAIGVAGEQTFVISWGHAVIILVIATIFAFGGNTISLKALEIAPNPGYSLVLSKSYVLFTSLVAVAFLGAELTARKAIAILIIVGFSILIVVNKKVNKHDKDGKWVALSFGAFFAWGMLSLSSKFLFNHGVATIPYLVYLYAIVTMCILLTSKIKWRVIKAISGSDKLLLLGTGIFATLFGLGQFQAIKLAPNVGYVNAINAGSISVVTICAVILFKDDLTPKKAIGVLGVTVGLILLLT